MKNYEYKKLHWDTQYFECLSSRIDIFGLLKESDIQNIKKHINKDEFITITNSKGIMENNKFITSELKANLVDINIQLKSIEDDWKNSNIKDLSAVAIYNNYPYNDKIFSLVENTFIYSRFYNDSFLKNQKNKISNIYKNWIQNSFECKEKYFCIFEDECDLKGFLLFSYKNQKNIVIELIAVNEKYRSEGIGTVLINKLYAFCKEVKCQEVLVGTQLENIKALNFYIKNAFKIKDIKYIYHLWKVK
ncbi:GNAT family N-acetyltransferase [Turicibacter bilis]|uniref:GNAT family N-acetyltransferase n=1 Tax=Turicibacter bilis TaxID=2735723 RepID=UPI003F8C0641